MTTLLFQDTNDTIHVSYKTDLLAGNSGNFTVMQIDGLTNLDQGSLVGLNFRKLNYDLATFKKFATDNNLKLTQIDQKAATILVAIADIYAHGGLGIDNI